MLPRALILAAGLAAFALAQDGGIDAESQPDFYDKKLKLTRILRGELFKGQTLADAAKKEHREAIDVAAKEVTYPLRWDANKDSAKPGRAEPSKLIKDTVEAFETQLRQLGRNKDQSSVHAMQGLYCKAITLRARDVIVAGPPLASVNAARMIAMIPARARGQSAKDWADDALPRLGHGTAEQILSVCADLIAGDTRTTNDGVRVMLLRAANDVMSLPPQKPPLYKQETADRVVVAALGPVTRKVEFTKASPRADVEGFKMLRAEALRVVARASAPTIGTDRPALVLARVAANDQSVVPAPRSEELVEAGIGLCRLVANAAKTPDLRPDYAAQQVARAALGFAVEANKNIETKTGSLRLRPWKIDAVRLLEGVDLMRVSKDAYVGQVVKEVRPVLVELEAGKVADTGALSTLLSGNAPPSPGLYASGDPGAVKPRASE